MLGHKLREALSAETEELRLCGAVAIDGTDVGGHVRTENAKANRTDRRLRANRRPDRRSVIALRERDGRTLTHVAPREGDGVEIAKAQVDGGATIYTDEGVHWDLLSDALSVERVNHSDAYSFFGGAHIHGVESYFARLRRMIRGQHHRISAGPLPDYAAQAAWLEDHRRESNGALANRLLSRALAAPRANPLRQQAAPLHSRELRYLKHPARPKITAEETTTIKRIAPG